jgi:hypothetical protein
VGRGLRGCRHRRERARARHRGLPHAEGVRNRKAKRIARELLRLDRKMDRLLQQAAKRPGHNHSARYANARRALARLLQVARAADHRGTLGVPLGPIEAAAGELLQRLAPGRTRGWVWRPYLRGAASPRCSTEPNGRVPPVRVGGREGAVGCGCTPCRRHRCWVRGEIRYRDLSWRRFTLASGERKVLGGTRETSGAGINMHVGETPNGKSVLTTGESTAGGLARFLASCWRPWPDVTGHLWGWRSDSCLPSRGNFGPRLSEGFQQTAKNRGGGYPEGDASRGLRPASARCRFWCRLTTESDRTT